MELPAGEFVRRPGKDVVERRVGALDAGGREQRERREAGSSADRDLGRDPATEAVSDEVNADATGVVVTVTSAMPLLPPVLAAT